MTLVTCSHCARRLKFGGRSGVTDDGSKIRIPVHFDHDGLRCHGSWTYVTKLSKGERNGYEN